MALALAGCAAEPVLTAPSGAQPAVCAKTVVPGVAATELAVAPTTTGATVAWAGDGGVWRVELDTAAAPELIAPGAFDRAVAASVGDRVIVGATSGDTTQVFGAAFGLAPYRELALLGGVAGASPVVTAGGARLAPSVWYGGLLVAWFDESWLPHTAELAVLTPASTEVAAVAAGNEAVIAWSAGGSCYVERAQGVTAGSAWAEAGACGDPHVASIGSGVALAFARPDGVYLALAASPGQLHPSAAPLVAPGARAPRLTAAGGAYWLAYIDEAGVATAVQIDPSGAASTLALAPASALEIADLGGVPRVLAIEAAGLTATALCLE